MVERQAVACSMTLFRTSLGRYWNGKGVGDCAKWLKLYSEAMSTNSQAMLQATDVERFESSDDDDGECLSR